MCLTSGGVGEGIKILIFLFYMATRTNIHRRCSFEKSAQLKFRFSIFHCYCSEGPINKLRTLREKCLNTEFFLVCIFLYSG